MQIPLDQDLDAALEALRDETSGDVYVSSLGEKTAVVTLREPTPSLVTPTAWRATCACGRTGGCAPPACSREPVAATLAPGRRARARRAARAAAAGAAEEARQARAQDRDPRRRPRRAHRACAARRRHGRRDRVPPGVLARLARALLDRAEHVRLRRGRLAPRSIPSEGRNRQKVPWREISPWVPKATVAIEDKRYWQHGGIDPIGISRAFWADISAGQGRPGRLDDHAAARPEPLHLARADVHAQAARGVSGGQARRQVVEAEDPHDLPQPDLLRQPGVRGRGGRADVLLEAGEEADARAGGAPRRTSPGAFAIRPVREPTRGARETKAGAARDADDGRDHEAPVPARGPRTTISISRPASCTSGSSSRTSSATCATSSCAPTARRASGTAGCASTRRSTRSCSVTRGRRSTNAERAGRPCGRGRRDQPGERRDPCDDRGLPGAQAQPVQPHRRRASAGRLDLQAVRPRHGDRAGHGPGVDVLPLGAARLLHRPVRGQAVARRDVRPHVQGQHVGGQRDAELGQHGLRASHARRRRREGRDMAKRSACARAST